MLCVLAVFQVDSRGQVENWSKIRFCLLVDPAWRKSQSVNLASFFSPKYSWVRRSKKLFMAYWGQLSLGESRLKPSWPAMRSSRNYEWDTNTDSQEEDLNDDCPPSYGPLWLSPKTSVPSGQSTMLSREFCVQG